MEPGVFFMTINSLQPTRINREKLVSLTSVYTVSMKKIEKIDRQLLGTFQKISEPSARIALFVIFFWFGILKVIGTSPALGLVQELFNTTFLSALPFGTFFAVFGAYEMIIGILFLSRRSERIAIALLIPHMVMTMMPLFLMPDAAWQSFLTPTLEGQYIIKNLALIALAFFTTIHLRPIHIHKK